MKFYGIGIQKRKDKTGELVNASVLIDNLPNDRLGALRKAEQIAKSNKIQLQGVYPARNVQ